MSFWGSVGGFFTSGEGFDIWDVPSAVGTGIGNAFNAVGGAIGAAFDGDSNTHVYDAIKGAFSDAPTSVAASSAAAGVSPPSRGFDSLVGQGNETSGGGSNLYIGNSDKPDLDNMNRDELTDYLLRESARPEKTSFADIAIALSPIAISIMNAKNAKKENEKDREATEELQENKISAELLSQQRAQEHANSLATMQANFQLRNAVQQVKQVAGPGISTRGSSNVIRDRKGA